MTADNTAYLSYGDRVMRQFLEEQTGADFSGTSGEAWTVEEESVPGLETRIYRYHRG